MLKKVAICFFAAGIALAQTPDEDNSARPAVIAGMVVAANGKPLSSVGVEALRLDYHGGRPFVRNPVGGIGVRSDDRGQFRISVPPGDYYVRTLITTLSAEGSNVTRFAGTYYPGTLVLENAKLIQVRSGSTYEGINIVDAGRKLHKVSGTFIGAPNEGNMWAVFYPREGPHGHYGPFPLPIERVGDGRFRLTIPQGSWDVYAAHTVGRPINSPGTSITHFGSFSADVNDADVDGFVLDFKPTMTVSGQILAPPGLKLKGEITLEGLSGIPEQLFNAQAMTRAIAPTGVFEITGAPQGEFVVTLRNLPPGIYVSDIRTGNTSIFGSPLKVANKPLKDVLIILNDDVGSVDGVLVAEDGKPVPNKTVIAVPPIGLQWNRMSYAYAITDKIGRFTMKDVAPGSYQLFAWEYRPEGRGRDDVVVAPDILERYKNAGVSVTVDSARTTENIQLQLIPWN